MVNLKKFFVLPFMLVLVVLIGLECHTPVYASSKKTQALRAYKTLLSQKSFEIDGLKYSEANLSACSFTTAYIDGDTVPELVIYCPNKYGDANGFYDVFCYDNGKIKYITHAGIKFQYVKKRSVIKTAFWIYKIGGTTEQHIVIKNSMVKKIYNYRSEWRQNDTVKKEYSLTSYSDKTNYKFKYISSNAYKKAVKKFTGSKKAIEPKFYKNTAKNRKNKLE